MAFTRYFFVHSQASATHRHPAGSTKQLTYPGGHHAGVSPGEFTGSLWGLAPKKNSSEEVGLAEKGLAPGVSSKDWVEGVVSQVGLASLGVSVTSSRTGVELLGGLATVGAGWHSASDCHAALSRIQERGGP